MRGCTSTFRGARARVGLSFVRFDSVYLAFQRSALTSISLCLILNFALALLFYVRRRVFSLRHRICNWWKDFFKSNGLEHCFLSPAKLPHSAILDNCVNKIVSAISKIVEIAFVSPEPTRKWRHTVKSCLQPRNTYMFTYMLYNFSNTCKSYRFLLKFTFYWF